MKLRKAIKKIVALGAIGLLGATVVSAADLSDYPSPFIANGKFAGMLVVGDKAAAEDVIGVSDIAMSLQYAATIGVGTATTTTSVSGDAWLVGTGSKDLELSEMSSGVKREMIRNITSNIGESELDALSDGAVTNDKGTSKYHQYLHFDNSSSHTGYVEYVKSDDDVTADFFYLEAGVSIATYELEFTTSFESDISGTTLEDFEDEQITMMGVQYTIVRADRAASNRTKLTLMAGSIKDTLSEGETKTYDIDGTSYEVTVIAITDSSPIIAKFNINGESTKSLSDGSSTVLSDGTNIGISDIIPNEAGDVTQDLVEFYLGADKVILQDTDISDMESSKKLDVNGNTISDAEIVIKGSDDGTTVKIDNILVYIEADDEFYVGAGEKLTDVMVVAGSETEALFTENWDIQYEGLQGAETENIKIKSSGSKKYELEFVDADGNTVSLPIAYADGVNKLRFGDKNYNTTVNESDIIKRKDYFILTDASESNGQRNTWALQYKGADKSTDDDPTISFENLGSGTTIDRSYKNDNTTVLTLGGTNFKICQASDDTSDNFDIYIDLDGSGNSNCDGITRVNINTKFGAAINIIGNKTTGGSYNTLRANLTIEISTPDGDDYEDKQPTTLIYQIEANSDTEVDMNDKDVFSGNLITPEDEDNVGYGYNTMGAFITFKEPSSSPGQLTVEYPNKQRLPLVYFTAGATTTISGLSESVESVTINRIEVGATKLASEVASVGAQNLILVGGPCANAAAAEAKGSPADCAAGYEAGKGLIELIDTGAGNVALLVAGYSAADTRAATGVVANYGDYELAGDAMEVVTATSTVKEVTAAVATTTDDTTTDDTTTTT